MTKTFDAKRKSDTKKSQQNKVYKRNWFATLNPTKKSETYVRIFAALWQL